MWPQTSPVPFLRINSNSVPTKIHTTIGLNGNPTKHFSTFRTIGTVMGELCEEDFYQFDDRLTGGFSATMAEMSCKLSWFHHKLYPKQQRLQLFHVRCHKHDLLIIYGKPQHLIFYGLPVRHISDRPSRVLATKIKTHTQAIITGIFHLKYTLLQPIPLFNHINYFFQHIPIILHECRARSNMINKWSRVFFLSKKKNPAPMASYSGISWLRVQIDLPQPGCLLSPSNTENIVLTWCQLCRYCWHSRLLLWQLLVPPMPTKLASSRLYFFQCGIGGCLYNTCGATGGDKGIKTRFPEKTLLDGIQNIL